MHYARYGSQRWRCALCVGCFALAPLLLACRGKSSDYEQLCQIYREYSKPDLPRDIAAVKITERVEREPPTIYERYVVIVMNPVEGRYQAFKELATSQNVSNWSCDAIRAFYEAPRPGQ
jgi:hypothetical protein